MIDRLLIVGHGSIGKRHLRIARETLPNADIRILRHQSCAETPEFADGCFSNMDLACAFAPQAAIIANPAPFHLGTALAMAAIGCHLLVEKPLSHKASIVEPLLEKTRERKLILQVGYNLRFLPSLKQFRERIHTGAIGRVLSVRCEIGQYLPSWRPEADYRQGVSARQELGGGVLLELSHELDYLRWIFGEVDWVNAWLGRQSALEIDVEDMAHLTLGFAHNAAGVAPVAALSLDFIRHDTTRLCTAIGETGSLLWNGLTGKVDERLAGVKEWRKVFHHAHQLDDSYRDQFLHFLSCIQNGEAPQVTGIDGLAVLNIIESAKKSAFTQGVRVYVKHENQTSDTQLREKTGTFNTSQSRNGSDKDINAVGFIFARGGSKGLLDKNIRLFSGKPLIAWAIEHARAIRRLRRVIVSTDSEAIAAIAREYGAEVPFLRPAELARDDSPEWLAWRHALTYLRDTGGTLPEAMVSIPTTAPLRIPFDIENCLDEFAKGGADMVITVTEAHRNPWFNMVNTQADGTVGLVIPPTNGIFHRQNAPPVYDMATVAYVADPAFVLSHSSIFAGRVKAVQVPVERAIDIDTLLDFEMAEFLMNRRTKK